MPTSTVSQIGVLLIVAAVWILLNLKAGSGWLKFVSLWAALAFLAAASFLAIVEAF